MKPVRPALPRSIFAAISPQRLPDAEKRALLLIRAQLAELEDDFVTGLRDLRSIEWQQPTRISAQAHALRARFLRELGYSENAMQEYQSGLDILANLVEQQVILHTSRVTLLRRDRNFFQAWVEIKRAQNVARNNWLVLLMQLGRYAEALATARTGQDTFAEAYAWRGLGRAYAAQGQTGPAHSAWQKAIALFAALKMENEVNLTQKEM